ncbi:hypothetical protein [Kiloniella litopenaei]|uniref:hypothetical protein n=1 Tax=Kiloniella litopenaei TaxID=1549748 RepID=UPI003BACFC85
MPIKVTLNCQLNAEKTDELIIFLQQNLPNVRNFHGNKRVEIFFDRAKQEMLIDEDWKSVEDHQKYIKYITDNGIMANLISYFLEPPSVKYFNYQDL